MRDVYTKQFKTMQCNNVTPKLVDDVERLSPGLSVEEGFVRWGSPQPPWPGVIPGPGHCPVPAIVASARLSASSLASCLPGVYQFGGGWVARWRVGCQVEQEATCHLAAPLWPLSDGRVLFLRCQMVEC